MKSQRLMWFTAVAVLAVLAGSAPLAAQKPEKKNPISVKTRWLCAVRVSLLHRFLFLPLFQGAILLKGDKQK